MYQSKYTTQYQLAQDGIIWDCSSCGSDEAQFHRIGKLAGIAVCRDCGHKWNWKKKPADSNENGSTHANDSKDTNRDQTGAKDVDGVNAWLNVLPLSTPLSPTLSTKTAINDGSFQRSRQKVQALRQQAAASSSKKPEIVADKMIGAWPKRTLKKQTPKKPLRAKVESSESEFEYDASDGDFSDDDDKPKQKAARSKGKQLAGPQSRVPDNDDDNDDDDDDNDSIFSDTANDVYKDRSGSDVENAEPDSITIEGLLEDSTKPGGQKLPSAMNKHSMFMLFNKANRKRLFNENPDVTGPELSKLVALAFRQITPEEREELRKKAAEHREEVLKLRPPKLSVPRNGYILFNAEHSGKVLADNPEFRMRDMNAVISRMWRSLSDEERAEYAQRAKQLRENFAKRFPDHHKAKALKRKAKIRETLAQTHEKKKQKEDKEMGRA